MGKSLPFPAHKHPPRNAGILAKVGSVASQVAATGGEDQGSPGEVPTGEESPPSDGSESDEAEGPG